MHDVHTGSDGDHTDVEALAGRGVPVGTRAPEVLIRAIVTSGRAIATESSAGDTLVRIEPDSYRVVASALLGVEVDRERLDIGLDEFATDHNGYARFDAMVDRARVAVSTPEVARSAQSTDDARLRQLAHSAVILAFARALARRGDEVGRSYERFSNVASTIVHAVDYEAVCERTTTAVRELSGLQSAVLYVPGEERARFVAADRDSEEGGPLPPLDVRIDVGLVADVLAQERVVYISSPEPIEELSTSSSAVRTVVAVPLRDGVGRPIGVAVGLDSQQKDIVVDAVESLRRLGTVVQGALAVTLAAKRDRAALATLPLLATVAEASDTPITGQLEHLARIVTQATQSDAAVVRIRDAAGHYLETRAVHGLQGDASSDLIGSRTVLDEGDTAGSEIGVGEHELMDHVDGWSHAGDRILSSLGARSVLSIPIPSIYQRSGVLYIVRKTARPFDDVDRASGRILCAHLQHVIDRHVAGLQTQRAIRAARSAVRMLGEAMVAGVRTERTLRFVPRLFREMFDATGCRVWRREYAGGLAMISSTGTFARHEASAAVEDALDHPLTLCLATEARPHSAAVAVDEYAGTRVAFEFELRRERTLGQEEQRIAIDVAERISEALYSADRAVAHQRQIERIQVLQDVVALAHEELSEGHVVATIASEVPALYKTGVWCVVVFNERGELEVRSSANIPADVQRAIERLRHWVPGAVGDERLSVIVSPAVGLDPRLGELSKVFDAAELGHRPALMIPLIARSQGVGCVILLPESLSEDDIGVEQRTLPIFGRHIGAALLNARDHEREQRATGRLQRVLEHERDASRQVRALYEVSRTFATSLSLDETMRAVVESMADRLDVDAVWLRTPDDRGDKLLLQAFHSPNQSLGEVLERIVGAPEMRADPVNAHVWATRQPLRITNETIARGEHGDAEISRRLLPFLTPGSSLVVMPIATPTKMLGTVTMLSIDVEHSLTDEKVDTAAGVTSQAALALDNARLYKEQKRFADVIQESLLPSSLPQVPGIDLSVLYRSATGGGAEVGGDFYDFLELDDGRLALVVGDVCGKGVGAAANTAMTKYIFRALAREHPMPSAFLTYANDVICEEIEEGKFVTLFYALLDPIRGTVVCSNAGHPEPKLVKVGDNGDGIVDSLSMQGLALGILPNQDYEQKEYPFPSGSSIVVYTDGVVEARRGGRLYGQYRLERLLSEEAGASAPHLTFEVYKDCEAYAEEGLADDVAIVVAQRVEVEDAQ